LVDVYTVATSERWKAHAGTKAEKTTWRDIEITRDYVHKGDKTEASLEKARL